MSFCQSLSLDVSGRFKKMVEEFEISNASRNSGNFLSQSSFSHEQRNSVGPLIWKKKPETNSKFTPDKRVLGDDSASFWSSADL